MLSWLIILSLFVGTAPGSPAPPDVQRLVDARIAAGHTPGLAVGIIDRDPGVRM